MLDIFLKTLPFFALIGIGYGAAASRFFPAEEVAWLTKFVFYFALSAMLVRFPATLPIEAITNVDFMLAYLLASIGVYGLVTAVAYARRTGAAEAAIEAQCGTIGNVGFLAIPMLVSLLGEQVVAPILMVLVVDLIFFGTLIVVILSAPGGRLSPAIVLTIGRGLIQNPMIVSMSLGLVWSASGLPLPGPVDDFLVLLGAAATPCALFAIGASLAGKSAERLSVALWLSTAKLVIHPLAVAGVALFLFDLDPFMTGVMIMTAAMPVAGNVYILAQHYDVAPQRASSSILASTVLSIVTLSIVVGLFAS
ncbi:MAG: AEC family transporter [Pseudomonadota bacterium]